MSSFFSTAIAASVSRVWFRAGPVKPSEEEGEKMCRYRYRNHPAVLPLRGSGALISAGLVNLTLDFLSVYGYKAQLGGRKLLVSKLVITAVRRACSQKQLDSSVKIVTSRSDFACPPSHCVLCRAGATPDKRNLSLSG